MSFNIEKHLISYLLETNKAQTILSGLVGYSVEYLDIQCALQEVFNLKDSTSLLDLKLKSTKIVKVLRNFNFRKYHPDILDTIVLAKPIIPSKIPKLLTEGIAKHNNEIWELHKSDPDKILPVHAHNYEANVKLDLSNGKLYRKTQLLVHKIRKKNLIKIRNKFRNQALLPKLLI